MGNKVTPFVDIVFDGPPGHEGGRFVEVEDHKGRSIRYGVWIELPEGKWVLRIPKTHDLNEYIKESHNEKSKTHKFSVELSKNTIRMLVLKHLVEILQQAHVQYKDFTKCDVRLNPRFRETTADGPIFFVDVEVSQDEAAIRKDEVQETVIGHIDHGGQHL